MPIPSLNEHGLLPSGVHEATMSEIREVFGLRTPRRVELYTKLDEFLVLAASFKVFKRIFVDGSFVTDKDSPGDVDAVLELPRDALRGLLTDPRSLELIDTGAVKARYEVHSFLRPTPPTPEEGDMTRFFQKLRPEEAIARGLPPDARRGILRVVL